MSASSVCVFGHAERTGTRAIGKFVRRSLIGLDSVSIS